MKEATRGVLLAPDTEAKKMKVRHFLICMGVNNPKEYRLTTDEGSRLVIFARLTAEQEHLLRKCVGNLAHEKITMYG